MSGHTPGPWVLSYDQGSTRDIVASPDPLPICTVRLPWITHEQYAANARLIAASPCLLAALQSILAEVTPGILPHSTDSYLPQHLIDAGLAAVAKASP